MNYKDGDTITVNGKACRIEGSALVPVVKRGPLGGELKRLDQCKIGHRVNVGAVVGENCCLHFDGVIGRNLLVETNIPPRPTFTPMSAGDAAKLPDIVGRWVAVQVEKTDGYEVVLGDEKYERWFDGDDQILLIEGVDLP